MISPEKYLKETCAQFYEIYNRYCSFVIERKRQDDAKISLSGAAIKNIINLEKQLISQYFNGFKDLNGKNIFGIIDIYTEYFKLKKYRIYDLEINNIENEMNDFWEKRLLNFENLLKSSYAISDIFNFKEKFLKLELMPIVKIEINQCITNFRKIKLEHHIHPFKRFLKIFVPLGAAIGFITGIFQLLLYINPFWPKIKIVFLSIFK